ncbi:MAG: MBL fold metallo-hydrolase [Deltaproteobacteria bacterium]
MGFKDLLEKKLGPMRELVERTPRIPAADRPDSNQLWYRRAAGIEVRLRLDQSWAEAELGRFGATFTSLRLDDAALVAGLTDWRTAAECDVAADKLWRLVEDDLLFFARERPDAPLTGRANVIAEGAKIARMRSAWPTLAVETAVQIAPMPFMPRGRDLVGADAVGFRFACLERGHEVYAVNMLADDTIGGVLRDVVARLDGRSTADQIVDTFDRRHRATAKKLLAMMDRFALLEPAPARDGRFEDVTEDRVTWLGHAAVLLQTPTTNVLFDPLFFSASVPEAPHLSAPKLDPRQLPRIDAVVITHPDNDHLNPNSLAMIPTDTRVIVPRTGREPPPYQVDTLGIVRVLGFTDVEELDPWVSTTVGDVVVTGVPFVGESWGLDLAKLTYLARTGGGHAVYLSADSAEMPEVYDRLAGEGVDFAFMGVSGCAEAYVMPRDLGYGNFYEDWIPHVMRNEWVRHCAGPEQARASVARMKPRRAFGYAAGGASYIATAYSDVGSHAAFAALLEADPDLDVEAAHLEIGVPFSIGRRSSAG